MTRLPTLYSKGAKSALKSCNQVDNMVQQITPISATQMLLKMQRELLTSEYDDIRTSIATVISLCHLLAEKVRTLLMLSKARCV